MLILVVGSICVGTAGAEDLKVSVFDIGGGLCTLSEAPGGVFMVYDAGVGLAVDKPNLCGDRVHAEMPAGESIDLLVLSHSDADHINSVARLLKLRDVRRVIRTGHERNTKAWCTTDYWIKVEVGGGRALPWWKRIRAIRRCRNTSKETVVPLDPYPPAKKVDFNLEHHPLQPGEQVALGPSVSLTLLHGLHDAPSSWDGHFAPSRLTSRSRNAISIIAKLDFHNRSLLLTGDSVGLDKDGERRVQAPCVATEAALIRGHDRGDFDLNSDVLVAPHHGSNNGSCLDFIRKVSPGWVIFASGHAHHHPSEVAAKRYLAAGVPERRLLRTDRGDREGGGEWKDENTPTGNCTDRPGDDDIIIYLRDDGTAPSVSYARNHSSTC